MFEVLGIDRGTTSTKDSKGGIIDSIIRRKKHNEIILNGPVSENKKVFFNYLGNDYVIGEKGNYSVDTEKSKHSYTGLLLLTAIAMNFPDKENIPIKIVSCLPIGSYMKQKDDMENVLKKNFEHVIRINNDLKCIKLLDHTTFPESAAAHYVQDEKNEIMIDAGGLSLDVSEYANDDLEKYSTYTLGSLKMYSKIANYLNDEYGLDLKEWEIQDVLTDGLDGELKNVKLDFTEYFETHILEILERLKLEYDIKRKSVNICGGFGEFLHPLLKKHIPHIRLIGTPIPKETDKDKITKQQYLNSPQFAIAKGLGIIGRVLYNV